MAAMADSGGVLNWVLGEYGLFVVEMGPLQDLLSPFKSSTRIKYTCMAVGQRYIAIGATSGGLYVYNRKTLQYIRLIATKDGGIRIVCFCQSKNILGVATSSGIILVWDVGSRTRQKPKCLRRCEQHKDAIITCLCWDDHGSRLFAGDDRGFVSVTNLPSSSKFGGSSHNKRITIGHSSDIIGKSETPINQLDYASDKLLISTMTKTAVLDLVTTQCWLVGSKPREGKFGACYLKQKTQEGATIYTARPSSRLWEASMDGEVLSTQQYKHLLAVPPSPVLGHCHSASFSQPTSQHKPQSINFTKLLLIRDRFLLTWYGNQIYLLDPVLGQLVGWYNLENEVVDVCCHGNQFYVDHMDGHMTWFGVLTVKECVARLFEIDERQQCAQVALDCKQYLILGAARDCVPLTMIMSLKESLQDQPEFKYLVSGLGELEQQLEEPTNSASDRPPDYHGDDRITESPETMSISSDVCSHHQDSGLEDDDSLSSSHVDVKGRHSSGVGRSLKQPLSGDFSIETALFSVAAKAKKFAEERQKGNVKLRLPVLRKQSINSEPSQLSTSREESSPEKDFLKNQSYCLTSSPVSISGQGDHEREVRAEEVGFWSPTVSPSAVERTLSVPNASGASEVSMYLSDDNESRHEDDVFEAGIKKEKGVAKEKKRRRKKVVTVDIDTPSSKQGEGKALMPKTKQMTDEKNHSGSYSSFGDTK